MRLFDITKAQRLMDAAGIDLLLASTRHNVSYLSDYWHSVSDAYYALWDPSVTHMTLAGLPKASGIPPFLVAGASEMTTLEAANPWIQDRYYWGPGYYIQTWKESRPDPGNPMDTVADVIREDQHEPRVQRFARLAIKPFMQR